MVVSADRFRDGVVSVLDPPERLLCGPGPCNVSPRVWAAMAKPMLGHLDPDLIPILDEVVELLRATYRRADGLTLPLSSTGTAGAEAGIAALVERGDTIIVGVAGYFGARIAEIARRHGADVIEVSVPVGTCVPTEHLLEALRAHPEARVLAVVHAETSTGVRQPLEELAAAVRATETLLFVDCVTSLGGIELEPELWGIDYCYSCSQKCLGAPPGLSPVSLSKRAFDRIRERKHAFPFVFDFELLAGYWVERPLTYHHTVPVPQIYALHEALRTVLEEGLEACWRRHADAGAYLQEGLRERGLELLADPECQLPQLTAVRVPAGIDGRHVLNTLRTEHGIELGGGLGSLAPPIWRIGLMGQNATRENAERVLAGLNAVLP